MARLIIPTETISVEMPRTTEIDPDYSEISMSFPTRDLEITIERRQGHRRSGSVLREYRANSFSRLDLKGSINGQTVNFRNLRCREVRDVIYQAE